MHHHCHYCYCYSFQHSVWLCHCPFAWISSYRWPPNSYPLFDSLLMCHCCWMRCQAYRERHHLDCSRYQTPCPPSNCWVVQAGRMALATLMNMTTTMTMVLLQPPPLYCLTTKTFYSVTSPQSAELHLLFQLYENKMIKQNFKYFSWGLSMCSDRMQKTTMVII